MLWILKNKNTNDVIEGPKPLPENWGPIFGLHNVSDRIGDLSWVGIDDLGWFQVEGSESSPEIISESELMWNKAKALLVDSDWSMLSDVPMTVSQKRQWIEYRKALREIKLQPDFPSSISWPSKPQ